MRLVIGWLALTSAVFGFGLAFGCDGSTEAAGGTGNASGAGGTASGGASGTGNASGESGVDCAVDGGGVLMCDGGCTSACGCSSCQFEGITKAVDGGVLLCVVGGCYQFIEGKPCPSEEAPCASDEYCGEVYANCGGWGVCAKKPSACDSSCNGVCGCDGKYYCNWCFAHLAGVQVNASDTGCLPDGGDAGAD